MSRSPTLWRVCVHCLFTLTTQLPLDVSVAYTVTSLRTLSLHSHHPAPTRCLPPSYHPPFSHTIMMRCCRMGTEETALSTTAPDTPHSRHGARGAPTNWVSIQGLSRRNGEQSGDEQRTQERGYHYKTSRRKRVGRWLQLVGLCCPTSIRCMLLFVVSHYT